QFAFPLRPTVPPCPSTRRPFVPVETAPASGQTAPDLSPNALTFPTNDGRGDEFNSTTPRTPPGSCNPSPSAAAVGCRTPRRTRRSPPAPPRASRRFVGRPPRV